MVAGLKISFGIGCVIALIGQTLLPVLAKLPGLVLCAGGGFELVLRRRDSYGVCSDGANIHYVVVVVVSALVWAVVRSPLGLLVAREQARKSGAR